MQRRTTSSHLNINPFGNQVINIWKRKKTSVDNGNKHGNYVPCSINLNVSSVCFRS